MTGGQGQFNKLKFAWVVFHDRIYPKNTFYKLNFAVYNQHTTEGLAKKM